jgi:F-type H+-transporting ATPase subunit delta
MATGKKQIQQLARQLFKLSFAGDELSADRVAGVLAYLERHRPAHTIAVLKGYQRLIAAEVARSQAIVEHAGPIGDPILVSIAGAMTKKYARKITSLAKRNDALLAGLRVRVGDDLYESSAAGQLATLAGAL